MHLVIAICSILIIEAAVPLQKRSDDYGMPNVEPEYLDKLLKEGRYEEFSYLMDIDSPYLSRPGKGNQTEELMMRKELEFGDILTGSRREEEGRQGIRFNKYGGSKWKNGYVPYVISNAYSSTAKNKILQGIRTWNSHVRCLKFRPRTNENAYVMFFSGSGCYSYLGRRGAQQPISLQDPGCFRIGTILHEMQHAVGFAHEQNRSDRDNHIRILWGNIPVGWRSQYQKTNPNDYGLQRRYDYYSVMHYSIYAPYTNKRAFEVLDKNIDVNRIGQRQDFSQTDLDKISDLYC